MSYEMRWIILQQMGRVRRLLDAQEAECTTIIQASSRSIQAG